MRIRAAAIFALVTALSVTGCAKKSEKLGSPAVHARISALSTCPEVQREFDIASANFDRIAKGTEGSKAVLSYMDTALERMHELGCR